MQIFDTTLPTPAENLALDEALLDYCEEQGGPGILRFWTPKELFVVVGYGNLISKEVNVDACRSRNIPIFRRCSGGGTIVQMPGCLNYALILKTEGPFASIPDANRHIMARIARALAKATKLPISVNGCTDLVIGDRKFSGNSQRRKKNYLLFHGCILLNANLSLISELLTHPTREPDYRQSRPHADFLTNLSIDEPAVKSALTTEWASLLNSSPIAPLAPAVTSIGPELLAKYQSSEWNLRFI